MQYSRHSRLAADDARYALRPHRSGLTRLESFVLGACVGASLCSVVYKSPGVDALKPALVEYLRTRAEEQAGGPAVAKDGLLGSVSSWIFQQSGAAVLAMAPPEVYDWYLLKVAKMDLVSRSGTPQTTLYWVGAWERWVLGLERRREPDGAIAHRWLPMTLSSRSPFSEAASPSHVKVLFACVAGGRAWGISSADSDYDVRFIYRHPPPWYVSIDPAKKDTISFQLGAALDFVGWDVRKAATLMRESNPSLSDWLRSPVIFVESGAFVPQARALSQKFYSRRATAKHLVAFARKHDDLYFRGPKMVILKKYFYVLHPLLSLCWLRANAEGQPPLDMADLLASTLASGLVPPATAARVSQLLQGKRDGLAMGLGERIPELDAFIASSLADGQAYAESLPASLPPHAIPADEFDRLLWAAVHS